MPFCESKSSNNFLKIAKKYTFFIFLITFLQKLFSILPIFFECRICQFFFLFRSFYSSFFSGESIPKITDVCARNGEVNLF